jgi:hypothetical protein
MDVTQQTKMSTVACCSTSFVCALPCITFNESGSGVEKNIIHNKGHPWMQLESDAVNRKIDQEYDQGPLDLDSGNQWL